MHQIDPPNGEKVIASTIGILHAFQFLEDVLLSRKPGKRKNNRRGRYVYLMMFVTSVDVF